MSFPEAPVAVVVVSYNTRMLLARCLDSLQPEVDARRATVHVVDNASTDGSAALVREAYPWAQITASRTNLGFGPAVNLGAASAPGAAWIAPANADVALEPGALEALLRAGAADPGAGAVAPRLIQPDGATQHSLHPFPTAGFTALFNLGLQGIVPRWADAMCLEGHWDAERPRRAPWAIGAFMLVRRAAWTAVGGFAEHQWMYAEDLDLGWRLHRAGWATRYVPEARVRHEVSAATGAEWGEARSELWMRATYAWMERRRGVPITRLVAALNVAGALARVAVHAAAARWGGNSAQAAASAQARHVNWSWARLHAVGLRRARSERGPL